MQVTISDSIVMGHVTIGDGCTIKNSIISSNVHIGVKCSLDRVQVPVHAHTARIGTVSFRTVSQPCRHTQSEALIVVLPLQVGSAYTVPDRTSAKNTQLLSDEMDDSDASDE